MYSALRDTMLTFIHYSLLCPYTDMHTYVLRCKYKYGKHMTLSVLKYWVYACPFRFFECYGLISKWMAIKTPAWLNHWCYLDLFWWWFCLSGICPAWSKNMLMLRFCHHEIGYAEPKDGCYITELSGLHHLKSPTLWRWDSFGCYFDQI